MIRIPALATLILISSVECSRADDSDRNFCKQNCRSAERSGIRALSAYAPHAGATGRLQLRAVAKRSVEEVARLRWVGARVFGPWGWCRVREVPVPKKGVLINVGDAGTPLRVGETELPVGALARFVDGQAIPCTLDALCAISGATPEVPTPTFELAEEGLPFWIVEPLSVVSLPPELEGWRRPDHDLVVLRVAWPTRPRVSLDLFSLWQDGAVIARCSGIVVDSSAVVRAGGATQIAFGAAPVPRVWLRFPEAMFERVVHCDATGKKPKLPLGPQLLVGDDLFVSEQGKTGQEVCSAMGFHLLGAEGCLTTIGAVRDSDETPSLQGERLPYLDLLFLVKSAPRSEVELRYSGRPLGSVSRLGSNADAGELAQRELQPRRAITNRPPSPSIEKPASKWPRYRSRLPKGRHSLSIRNNAGSSLKLGLRDDRRQGRDLWIAAGSSTSVTLGGGRFEVFATWGSEPGEVYQGDSFELSTNPDVQQQASLSFGAALGNYKLRRL